MNCKFCSRRKQVSLICVKDDSKMCEGCSEQHVRTTGHTKYIMTYIEWFKKQNESEVHRLSCVASCKKSIESTIKSLPSLEVSASELLDQRRKEIKSLIDRVAEDQIKKVNESREYGKFCYEKNFHTLYSRNPSASGLAHIISGLTSEEEVNSLIFSEIVEPEELYELESHLSLSLSIKHVVHSEGKPILIPYLKPNSSNALFYDVVHEKTVIRQYLNKSFAMYPAWCFAGNYKMVFSGGCLYESIRYEVFLIDPVDMVIQDLPPMVQERYRHGMIWFKGKLFVFGGVGTEGHLDSIESLAEGEQNWEICGKLVNKKAQMTVCVVGEKIYIGDESSIEVFNPVDNTCREISVFENIDFFIMVPFQSNFFILKHKFLYCVTPEPNFTTKKLSQITQMEYSNLGQAFLIFGKIFFMLDVNKTIFSFNLGNRELKPVACFA